MFARILKQSFNRQRRRKALAAAAVIAGMAVASAMLTLRVNLGDDLSRELRHVGANLVIRPANDSLPVTLNGVDLRPAGTGALLREAQLGRIKTIFWSNNIVDFAPILFVPVRMATPGGALVPVQLEGAYLDHLISDPGSGRVLHTGLEHLESGWQVQGRWPADSPAHLGAGDEILLGRRLATRLGVAPGAALELSAGALRRTVTVTGIASSGGAEDDELIGPLALAQALADAPGGVREVEVSAITKPEDAFAQRDPSSMNPADAERWSCSPYALTIASQLQHAWPGTAVAVIRPVADSEGVILAKLQLLLLLITGLALAASGLAIAGAMTAAVLERHGEIALMKAVGAQDRAIGSLFFSEAALLGVGGGGLGFIAGELLARLIATRLLGHPAAWKPALAPLVLLLAAAVALAGSWHPLRRALHIDPAVALRGEI